MIHSRYPRAALGLLLVPLTACTSRPSESTAPDPAAYAKKFTGRYIHRTITGGIGHNLPQEAPKAFADAVVEIDRG